MNLLALANRYRSSMDRAVASSANTGVSFGLHALRLDAPYHTAWDIDRERDRLFGAWERHWFRTSAEAWAFNRELELRNERKAHEAEHELAVVEWPFELRQREDEW